MSIALRPYQQQLSLEIDAAWANGARNVLAVAPTGSGKTVLFSEKIRQFNGASVAVAHRQELVSQISMALARNELRHSIIAPQSVVRGIVALQISELDRHYYDPNARCRVAGVDTLIRMKPTDSWFPQVGLWIMDEAHHVLTDNKWGKAVKMFPNARGLGVTATPCRADGKGLGSHADGVADAMVQGPTMRELISVGFLTEYKLIAPRNRVDLSNVPIGASGDYSPKPLVQAVRKAEIVGDVVEAYLKFAAGKLGVTFSVSVEDASQQAAAYRAAGVPAEVVSSETPDLLRAQILRRFRNREILQLVNVDLFGEGFDLPAIEVVSMARPTQSYGLYVQQFGRALRPMDGKTHAIIIDHVENYLRHGLPDRARVWSLDRRPSRARSAPDDAIPLRGCLNCFGVYERVLKSCPYCGHRPEPAGRATPEMVEGDLEELAPDVLAALRGEIERIDGAVSVPHGLSLPAQYGLANRHRERQNAQFHLRQAMAMWGGARTAEGDDLATAQRRFWHRFGIDVATAQTLGARDATELKERIERWLVS